MNLPSSALASRWTSFSTSIFTEMTELAKKHRAVNLAQGFPDFPGPKKILDAAAHHILTCHNQYAPSAGEMPLRQALSEWILRTTGTYYDPLTEITVTAGASEGLYAAINAFVNPGDKVLLFEPYFDVYAQAVANAGGEVVPIRIHAPDTPIGIKGGGWTVDWDEFDAAMSTGQVKVVLLNTPHNPTGKVFNREELDRISSRLERSEAVAVLDEVYETLVYGSAEHVSLASENRVRDRIVRISSAAKTFGFTGFKIGWVCAARPLSDAVRLVHQGIVFCTNPHLQLALADAISDVAWLDTYLGETRAAYSAKHDFLAGTLERAGYRVQRAQGSYFLMANYETLAGDVSDVLYARQLIDTRHVAALPTSVFYSQAPKSLPWLRFAFCKADATLQEAADYLLRS